VGTRAAVVGDVRISHDRDNETSTEWQRVAIEAWCTARGHQRVKEAANPIVAGEFVLSVRRRVNDAPSARRWTGCQGSWGDLLFACDSVAVSIEARPIARFAAMQRRCAGGASFAAVCVVGVLLRYYDGALDRGRWCRRRIPNSEQTGGLGADHAVDGQVVDFL
jgi:hypothetical protein